MQGAGRCLANGFRPSCSCPAPRARSSCRPRAAAGRASPIGSRGGASTTRCATAAQSSRADPSSAAPSPTSSPPWRTAASCRWPSLGRRSGCSAIPSPSGWASSSSRDRPYRNTRTHTPHARMHAHTHNSRSALTQRTPHASPHTESLPREPSPRPSRRLAPQARSSSSSVRRRPPSCTAQQSGNFRRSSGTRTLSARSPTPQARTWATTR
mmetsp:Transcript_3420/g.12103  ORF Transcript_3420/g.12103 Transcript_3420/m.12103 type:complete len:211 (+) Transcript_3420:394-1026(+)